MCRAAVFVRPTTIRAELRRYNLAKDLPLGDGSGRWTPALREEFAERCLAVVEEYCPGFRDSVLHIDALSPLDLEEVFGLPGGNFHHGALSMAQLAYGRPSHRCPGT